MVFYFLNLKKYLGTNCVIEFFCTYFFVCWGLYSYAYIKKSSCNRLFVVGLEEGVIFIYNIEMDSRGDNNIGY